MTKMNGELKELVDKVYQELLGTTNRILHNCKSFEISVLQLEDPSYEQIADQLGEASDILWSISDHFPDDPDGMHLAFKASDYAQIVKNIAKAIRSADKDELKKLVSELDRRSIL